MGFQAAAPTARKGANESRERLGGRGQVVGLEVETPARTEARLRDVLRAAQIDILRHDYAWASLSREAFPAGISAEALALTQDGDGWNQLVPASGARRSDAWALVAFHFGPGANTDGFTDWLATCFRRRVGPKLMIASGFNERTGVSYLYWGVPARFREALAREIAILATPPVTGVRAVGLL